MTDDPGQLAALLGRLARSMGSGGLELGGENVRFEQEPERGLEVRVTLLDGDGEVSSVASILLPSATRPDAHPGDVPFIPGAPLRVLEDRARQVLLAMWLLDGDAAPDPETALPMVLRASRATGWRLENPADAGRSGPFRLLRGDELRRVESMAGHTGPVISLSQKRSV